MIIYKDGDETVKSSKDRVVHGMGVRFGSPETKDWDGEFFTPESEVGLVNGTTRPYLMEHGWHRTFGKSIVAQVTYEKSREGWLYEANFFDNKIGNDAFNEVISKPYRSSAGAAGHTRQATMVKGAWHLDTWLIAEQSATLTPADNENARITRVKSSDDYLQMVVLGMQEELHKQFSERLEVVVAAFEKSTNESRERLANALTQLKDSFVNENKNVVEITPEFLESIEQVAQPIELIRL